MKTNSGFQPGKYTPEWVDDTSDEVFQVQEHYVPHEDKMYHTIWEPGEAALLEKNMELQKDPSKTPSELWGAPHVAEIPASAWAALIQKYGEDFLTDMKRMGKILRKEIQLHPEWAVKPKGYYMRTDRH